MMLTFLPAGVWHCCLRVTVVTQEAEVLEALDAGQV